MIPQTPSKQPTKEGEESNSPKQGPSVNTKAQKIARLKNKEYRDAFVASQISVGLPFQIRALREQRGWKQSRLAAEADMLQPRISAMERPGESKFNIETLRRIASAFDVALEVRFVPFSQLVDWSERFSPDNFSVPSFKQDLGLIEKKPLEGRTSIPIPAEGTGIGLRAIASAGEIPDWVTRLNTADEIMRWANQSEGVKTLQQLAALKPDLKGTPTSPQGGILHRAIAGPAQPLGGAGNVVRIDIKRTRVRWPRKNRLSLQNQTQIRLANS